MSPDGIAGHSENAPAASSREPPFGLVAMVGASLSLAFCYGQVLISLLMPLFGMAPFDLNIHVQAVFMWLFGLVTVYGLAPRPPGARQRGPACHRRLSPF